jgi:DNA-directed DNA polymerase III PolC
MSFIPLRVHSHWSLLAGVPSLAEIVTHAQQWQLPALALTDVNSLYGAIEFVQRCRAAQVQPILGVDFTFDTDHSLTLLAQDMTGYANLCRLVTRLQAHVDRETALARGLSLTDLADHSSGLIALSAGQHAARLIDLFTPDRFFLALDGAADTERAALADQLGVQVVAAPDIRYLSAADASRFRVLTAMRTVTQLYDSVRSSTASARSSQTAGTRFESDSSDYAFPTEDDLRQRFAAYPQALTNTQVIAERCRFEFPLGQYRFPTLDLPAGRTVRDELVAQTYTGAQQRYGAIDDRLEARLQKEIDVIDTLGYAPYFLVVADIVRYARAQSVPVSPRGSASSSVVAYCLGIHDVDPLAHDLYFERFLSLERHDPPDIDLDLCSHRRDEVIDYVYRRYGADHVAMVCTYATLQPRSALREVGKVYGLSEARLGELANDLPRFAHALRSAQVGRLAWHPGMRQQAHQAQAQLIEKARDPIEREVIAMSQTLTNFPHHLSIHPGGIVISPGPLTDLVPLQHATKGLLITQFDLKGIESLGLVKIDLLGISALTVAADCVALIQQRDPDFRLEKIPIDDAATIKTLSSAQTIGCFQIESGGMRFTLRELAAHSIADLIVALALYRPGPLKGGLKDAFVRRHLGQEPTEYLHPALEPILRETYGVVLYQEQVLRIAHEVAGFTLGEADLLRRAMSKFRSAHEMQRLREGFIAGAQRISGLDAPTAEKLWDLLAAFAGYGFPKAHAAGYAALAYRLAYLKTHYPAEFLAARLAVWGGYYSPRVYMSEARQLGLSVKPPHVNHSGENFTLDPIDRRTLWMGLGQVRELTHATIDLIRQHRPFTSLDDFLIRARPVQVEAINLIKCGALNGLGDLAQMMSRVETEAWHGRHSAQLSLLTLLPTTTAAVPSLAQRAAWEHEVLGYHVAVHPLDLVTDRLAEAGVISSRAISDHLDRSVALGGLRIAYHRVSAGRESLLLVDMEDQTGLYQVLWGGAALQQARPLINQRQPVLIRGRVRRDKRGLILIVGSAIELLTD